MRDRKRMSVGKIVMLVVIIIFLLGAVFFVANNILKKKGVEQDITDLASDHLDEAFADLEEVYFNIGS